MNYEFIHTKSYKREFTYQVYVCKFRQKQICTDLRSTDSKKASSFEKRTPPLSPIVEVDDGDEDDDDDEEEDD
jgi:hypothetical protein